MKSVTGTPISFKAEHHLQRQVALMLCFLLSISSDKGFSDVLTIKEVIGKVTAVSSATTRNGGGVSVKDVVRANDNLKTDNSGRVRVELQDGSILSLGSDTQLSIVNHDPGTGKTLVNLSSGRLRSRVVKWRSSGQFVVSTPQSTITAMGTDFFLDVGAHRTQVIVYSGVVVVTSNTASTDLNRKLLLDVDAGQTVMIDDKGVSNLQLTADGMEQQTIAETTVPEIVAAAPAKEALTGEPVTMKSSHTLRNVLLGGLAAGAVIGAVVGLRGSKSQSTPSSSSTPPTIPAH